MRVNPRLIILLSLCLLLLGTATPAFGQEDPDQEIEILSPFPGDPVQGSVAIRVKTSASGFQSAELEFSYARNPTNTWFLIAESDRPLSDEVMAEWDTSTLTDGTYNLRLVVKLKNGRLLSVQVPGIRVRNYSPIETPTPTPSPTLAPGEIPTSTPTPSPTPTPIRPTPTALPANPMQTTISDIGDDFLRGGAGVLAVFLLAGLYGQLRRGNRRL